MRKNKRGFTLIELLAVIIVLIVLIFIAVNKINDSMKKAKMNTIRANAIAYIKFLRDKAGEDVMESSNFDSGIFSVADLKSKGIILSGKEPDSGYVLLTDYKIISYCLAYGSYTVTDVDSSSLPSKGKCTVESLLENNSNFTVYDFDYSDNTTYTFKVPADTTYYIQLWGASGGSGWTSAGGNGKCDGGKGAYTSGIISLSKGDKLYINVGGKGINSASGMGVKNGGFNGGGKGGHGGGDDNAGSGGGATDIRLIEERSSMNSLTSRIMVAAGGGGGSCINHGTYNNIDYRNAVILNNPQAQTTAWNNPCTISANSQTSGYSFGKGQDADAGTVGHAAGGGGGGYWGGSYCYGADFRSGGMGGTSYVSGYTGCVAVASLGVTSPKDGCTDGTSDNNCSIHYSGYKFDNIKVASGMESMPKFNGSGDMIGNDGNGHARITVFDSSVLDIVDFNYSGSSKEFTISKDGNYRIELWGAQGGNITSSSYVGGKGAYTSGDIYLNKGQKLYFFVGENYNNYKNAMSFNGGGKGGYSTHNEYNANGGGATDVRLVNGSWDDFNSLKSRIMVAAGGGGSNVWSYGANGGAAGGLNGFSGTNSGSGSLVPASGASQTAGGLGFGNNTGTYQGTFGQGGYNVNYSDSWYYNSGGGGGYYGGGSGGAASGIVSSAAGGSSFISGHTGCNAISESSTKDNIVHTGSPNHYSNMVFHNTVMKAGNEEMPNYIDDSFMVGNTGSGHARITFID